MCIYYFEKNYDNGFKIGKAEGVAQGINADNIVITAHFHTTSGDGLEVFNSIEEYNNRMRSASVPGNQSSITGCYSVEHQVMESCGCHEDYGGNLQSCPHCGHSKNYHPRSTVDDGIRHVYTCSAPVWKGRIDYAIGCGYQQGEIVSVTIKK